MPPNTRDVSSIEYRRPHRSINRSIRRTTECFQRLDQYPIPKYKIVLCTFASAIIARRPIDVRLIRAQRSSRPTTICITNVRTTATKDPVHDRPTIPRVLQHRRLRVCALNALSLLARIEKLELLLNLINLYKDVMQYSEGFRIVTYVRPNQADLRSFLIVFLYHASEAGWGLLLRPLNFKSWLRPCNT